MYRLCCKVTERFPFYSVNVNFKLNSKIEDLRSEVFFRMMVKAKSGLIVNVSSAGGLSYLFNVPYGVGKAGVDRMSQDTAVELKKHNVTVLTLWPGPVKTELCTDLILGIDRLQIQCIHNLIFEGLRNDAKQ